jgi:hypothetical protein
MQDKIKNYNIQFMDSKLRQIEEVAGKRKIKSFILEAIEEKIMRDIKVLVIPKHDKETEAIINTIKANNDTSLRGVLHR